jgi:Zn-dependent protease with chaperone function
MLLTPAGRTLVVLAVLLLSAPAVSVLADRAHAASRSIYLPAEDVALGIEAAQEIRANVALITDDQLTMFVEGLGRSLVNRIPGALRQPAFRYSFEILDHAQVGLYGLPGGPVFLTRGLIQAAASETALAAAIARQVSHIVLRHGTTQAADGERFQIGAITGRDIGVAITGSRRDLTAQGAAFSAASYFLTYRNEFERQADRLASQLLTGAGYGGDAAAARSSDGFRQTQARLRDLPEPATPEGDPIVGNVARVGVLAPSGASRRVTAGDTLLLNVPMNWERMPVGNTVVFAPDDGFLKTPRGTMSLTHGVQLGIARSRTGDLQRDMEALLETVSRAGLNVQWRPSYQSTMMAGRKALTTTMGNVSAASGRFEQIVICTGHLPDGSLLYLIGVSPLDESGPYRLAFDRVRESIQPVR